MEKVPKISHLEALHSGETLYPYEKRQDFDETGFIQVLTRQETC